MQNSKARKKEKICENGQIIMWIWTALLLKSPLKTEKLSNYHSKRDWHNRLIYFNMSD